MNLGEALNIKAEYYDKSVRTEYDDLIFANALEYLIDYTNDARFMTELAWHYCANRRFDLEFKYLEMALAHGDSGALVGLGYMWYYGHNGEKDYERAFQYFSRGMSGKNDDRSLRCRYKLADMYHYGLYVSSDQDKYRKMIKEAYGDVKDSIFLHYPLPEIFFRYAGIEFEEGNISEADKLLCTAKRFMAERFIFEPPFWGHMKVMERIIRLMYDLKRFDEESFDIYDCFYLVGTPCKVRFVSDNKEYVITMMGQKGIYFENKWYKTFAEMVEKAILDDEVRLVEKYYEIHILGKETL